MSGLDALTHLAQRRDEIVDEQVLDLPIPRWENPEIHVLYKPTEHEVVRKNGMAVAKAKSNVSETELNQAASLLAWSCTGIYALVDGERYSLNAAAPKGELTRFDDDLADNLGISGAPTRSIVRKLFVTDADLLSASNKLIAWSGYADQEVDEALSGE